MWLPQWMVEIELGLLADDVILTVKTFPRYQFGALSVSFPAYKEDASTNIFRPILVHQKLWNTMFLPSIYSRERTGLTYPRLSSQRWVTGNNFNHNAFDFVRLALQSQWIVSWVAIFEFWWHFLILPVRFCRKMDDVGESFGDHDP